jgi:hypothetical protein
LNPHKISAYLKNFYSSDPMLLFEFKFSILVYLGLLVYEFSKKCQSACLFGSACLLGTSE